MAKKAEMGEGVMFATKKEMSGEPKVHGAEKNELEVIVMNQENKGEYEMWALVGAEYDEWMQDEGFVAEDVEKAKVKFYALDKAENGARETFGPDAVKSEKSMVDDVVDKGEAEDEVLMVEDAKEGEYVMFASDEVEFEELVAKDAKRKKGNKYEEFGRRTGSGRSE